MHQISFCFFQRGITPEREITRTRKKKCVNYSSMRNPYMKIQNHSMHGFWPTDAWTHTRTHNPKPICSRNFFEVGGIKIHQTPLKWKGQAQFASRLNRICLVLFGLVHFQFLGCLLYFFIFMLFLIEIPVCKQCRPTRSAASDLGLNCVPMSQKRGTRHKRLKILVHICSRRRWYPCSTLSTE